MGTAMGALATLQEEDKWVGCFVGVVVFVLGLICSLHGGLWFTGCMNSAGSCWGT